jgi:hypothetical protein
MMPLPQVNLVKNYKTNYRFAGTSFPSMKTGIGKSELEQGN